jgi:hypothetical protein
MIYNPRTNRIECPTCHLPMRPFGGRLTPGFRDLPEVFLCVGCGYNIDLNWAVGEALNQRALIKRRARNAARYMESYGYVQPPANGKRKLPLRKRMIRGLIRVLEKQVE